MGKLQRTVLAVLRRFPENSFHSSEEIWREVRAEVPLARYHDFLRAVGAIHQREVLVVGLLHDRPGQGGVALWEKITTTPAEVRLVWGKALLHSSPS